MTFISYAQNAEDVPLWRVFKNQPDGFYIDVGASGPDVSITTSFYQRGWSGLNLEPSPHLFEELVRSRPRDINLRLAASDQTGTATLLTDQTELAGFSTISSTIPENVRSTGFTGEQLTVPTTTLAAICAEHVRRPIDFLKIDVEGHERSVIAGADWERWRPRIVVVEATEPMSPTPNHHDWEPILLASGYLLALFDGLNRFYVRQEDETLLPIIGYPACIFDDFIPLRYRKDIDKLHAHSAQISKEREELYSHFQQVLARAEAAEGELAHHKKIISIFGFTIWRSRNSARRNKLNPAHEKS